MKKQRFLGKVASHAIALFLGVILTFSSIRVMSSNADTLPADSKINYKHNPIALKAESQTQAQAQVNTPSTSFVAAAITQTGPCGGEN